MSVNVFEAMSGYIQIIFDVIYLWEGQFWVVTLTHHLHKAAFDLNPARELSHELLHTTKSTVVLLYGMSFDMI